MGIFGMTDVVIKELTAENVGGAYYTEKSSLETPWGESELALLIGSEDKFYFTAISNDEVVGIAGFYKILDECMITNVAVLPNYRKQGIANALIIHLLEFASKKQCTFATLEVEEGNLPAILLYKKHGFYENGRRKGYYNGRDALLFRKEL